MGSSRNRIVLLGIDAASIDLIYTNSSRLPNFRRLLGSGVFRRLHSWGDVLSGSVWPSFATGKTPGEHGIYHHIQWNPGAMRLRRVTSDWLGYRPFWQDLVAAKKKVCVVDVPMSFPTLSEDALEIISWASHDELVPFFCNRHQIERELRRRFSKKPMGHEIPVSKSLPTLQGIRDRLVDCARQKGELIQWLLKLDQWDLFVAVFGETHRGGHLLWSIDNNVPNHGPSSDLLEVYAAVDKSLGLVCDSIDRSRTTLIIFAVHGMTRDISRAGVVPLVMDRVNLSHDQGVRFRSGPRQRSLMRFLRSTVPARVQHAIGQIVPVGVRDFVAARATAGGHDWSRTPGLALLADLSGYIRLNVKGRESQGILLPESAEAEHYVDTIDTCFRELVDAKTGESIVVDVTPRSKLFAGSHAELLPDIFVTWRDILGSQRARSDRLGSLPPEPATGRSGNHTADGFAVIHSGPQDLDGLPPLDGITDLSRLVHAAFARAATS